MNLKVWNILTLVALVFVINATATDDAKEKQLHANLMSAMAIRHDNFKKFGNRNGYRFGMKRHDEMRISNAEKAYTDHIESTAPLPVSPILVKQTFNPIPVPAARPPVKPTSKPVPVVAPGSIVKPTSKPVPIIAPGPTVKPTPKPVPVVAPGSIVKPTSKPVPIIAPGPTVKPTSKPVPVLHPAVPKATVKPVVIRATTTTTTTTTTPAPITVTERALNSEDNPVTAVDPPAE